MTIDATDQNQNNSSQNAASGKGDHDARTPVGNSYDAEPLLTAEDVGLMLQVPTKSVYELPIPKVRISERRIRYRPEDVQEFIESRASES